MFQRAYYLSGEYALWRPVLIVALGAIGSFLYSFIVKALNADIRKTYRKTKRLQNLCGIFTVAVALAIHLWSATLAWFTAYLGPRIGQAAAIAAVTVYQDDMLVAILPMYLPMVLFIGLHFAMLLTGKTRYPRWMLVFHPLTWNVLLAGIPDLAQAMQVPAATWMSVMSQSSANSAIVIWCIAAASYEKRHSLRQHRAIASLRFAGSFPPILRFEKFEIHTVFLHFPNLDLTINLSPNLLAELCGAALRRTELPK